eukprot:scaffold12210_cov124-Isochrysis_galbana.AAC.3
MSLFMLLITDFMFFEVCHASCAHLPSASCGRNRTLTAPTPPPVGLGVLVKRCGRCPPPCVWLGIAGKSPPPTPNSIARRRHSAMGAAVVPEHPCRNMALFLALDRPLLWVASGDDARAPMLHGSEANRRGGKALTGCFFLCGCRLCVRGRGSSRHIVSPSVRWRELVPVTKKSVRLQENPVLRTAV